MARARACTHTRTQPFNGRLSWTTQLSRYQEKPSPTHEEEEEGFALSIGHSVYGALSQQGLLSYHTTKVGRMTSSH